MHVTWGQLAEIATRASSAPTVPDPQPLPSPAARGQRMAIDLGPTGSLLNMLSRAQLGTITRRLGMTIPAMRSGHAKITKQPATWPLRAWRGDQLALVQPAWLANPDPTCTWWDLVATTLDDAIWHDRAYWRVLRRGADGFPLAFRRVPATDVQDEVGQPLTIAGKLPGEAFPSDPAPVVLTDGRVLESFLAFRWQGMGGMAGPGAVVLDLAVALLASATNYATSPIPSTTLVDEGAVRLSDDEVEALLTAWETKRAERSTAYVHGVKPEHQGWSARELQLVEAREHSALEVARSLALPAFAVDAANGASLQYSTTVENRRDLVEALRLWVAPLEQVLSLHAAARGTDLHLDVTSYIRDDASTRMATWASGLASGALTLPEVRAAEPLATGGTA